MARETVKRPPPWGLLLLAALGGAAGGVAGSILGGARATTGSPEVVELQPSTMELAERDARIERLEHDVARLERELAELASRDARSAPGRALVEPAGAGPVESRVDPDAPGLPGDDELDALRARALDGTRSTRERVLATRALWDIDLRTGMTGARTKEVVDALVLLLATEPDAELRRQISFSVLDATGPEHVGAFLSTLEHDPDPDVRAQAADTLQHHTDDPAVRAALERASLADASEDVRATAREMLDRAAREEE